MKTIRHTLAEGLRYLGAHPRFLVWLYVANLALALIPAWLVSSSIERSIEHSQIAEHLSQSFDDEWYREYQVSAQGLPSTFTPAVTGLGAVLEGLDAFVSGKIWNQYAPIVGLGVLLLLLWTFAAGGLIATFSGSSSDSASFWAHCGRHFGTLVRLVMLAGLFYLAAYKFLLPWVDDAIQTVNRQTVDERLAFAWVIAKYLLVLAYVFVVNLVFDYAKIVCVVENRRSAIGSAGRALTWVRSRPLAAIGLYSVLGLIGVGLILLYGIVAPDASQQSYAGVLLTLVLGQAFIASRVGLKLLYLASQTRLFLHQQ